ncbi:hypothetical protein RN001_006208 [Aquatica leii]|uniref:Serpin domain-containing protein n=1 Tax=Aquatica leii TaxID=1421715 RepID=A0AAN7Q1I5_9COLE|nr:hypothetical protein RN001_006208 [Aquatica leii]
MKILVILLLEIVAVQSYYDPLNAYSKGNLQFTANVYKQMSTTNFGNFLICPMSVETVFALMHAGAKGNTASEIESVFSFLNNNKYVHSVYKKLSPKFQHVGDYNVSSANKVYIRHGFKIKDDFKNVATQIFNTEVQEINFNRNKEAVNEINNWVEKYTNGNILNLLSKEDVNEHTNVVLVNSMYFKGLWLHEFDKGSTQKRNFYLNNQNTVDVDMMEITKRFKYHECQETDSKHLEMNFWGSDVAMTIILPNKKEGLAALEKNLENVFEVLNYQYELVHVRFPKFEISSKLELKSILNQLGILEAFKETADFSGIVHTDSNKKLKIDKVIQKTYIKVDEEGTSVAEGSAAVGAGGSSLVMRRLQRPKEFFADHPFIYVLKNPYGIMFVGRYVSNTRAVEFG